MLRRFLRISDRCLEKPRVRRKYNFYFPAAGIDRPASSSISSAAMAKGLPNDIDIYVGAKVRACRENRGLSQDRLARQLGISFQQLQKYEKGTNRISVGRLQAIASVLDIPIGQFFKGIDEQAALGDRNPDPDPAQFIATLEGLELIRAFRRIKSAEARKQVLALVKTLAQQDTAPGESQ